VRRQEDVLLQGLDPLPDCSVPMQAASGSRDGASAGGTRLRRRSGLPRPAATSGRRGSRRRTGSRHRDESRGDSGTTAPTDQTDGVATPSPEAKPWRALVGRFLVAAALGIGTLGPLSGSGTPRRPRIEWLASGTSGDFDTRELIGPALVVTVPFEIGGSDRLALGTPALN
jgi:hypothetical protein